MSTRTALIRAISAGITTEAEAERLVSEHEAALGPHDCHALHRHPSEKTAKLDNEERVAKVDDKETPAPGTVGRCKLCQGWHIFKQDDA